MKQPFRHRYSVHQDIATTQVIGNTSSHNKTPSRIARPLKDAMVARRISIPMLNRAATSRKWLAALTPT